MPPDKFDGTNNDPKPDPEAPLSLRQGSAPAEAARQLRGFGLTTLVLVFCFVIPLRDLIIFAAGSELYSYILLIPFISFYLVWIKRQNLSPACVPARGMTVGFLTAGLAVLAVYWLMVRHHFKLMEDDYLAVMTISFLLFFSGICSWFLGGRFLRANTFPMGFLVFMVPLPTVIVIGIDSFLQSGSAAVARGFFTMAGTPFLQERLVFQLPGITIQIAPECSGIHSSLVLFITSLVAGYLFLRTPWKRAVFILAVIPLGILRNGFRVFTIGELCVHIGSHMINSPIHRKGGPLFFALSLIPLFILLVYLQKSEKSGERSKIETWENPNPKPTE